MSLRISFVLKIFFVSPACCNGFLQEILAAGRLRMSKLQMRLSTQSINICHQEEKERGVVYTHYSLV